MPGAAANASPHLPDSSGGSFSHDDAEVDEIDNDPLEGMAYLRVTPSGREGMSVSGEIWPNILTSA